MYLLSLWIGGRGRCLLSLAPAALPRCQGRTSGASIANQLTGATLGYIPASRPHHPTHSEESVHASEMRPAPYRESCVSRCSPPLVEPTPASGWPPSPRKRCSTPRFLPSGSVSWWVPSVLQKESWGALEGFLVLIMVAHGGCAFSPAARHIL